MTTDIPRPQDTPGGDRLGDIFDEILVLRGDTVAWWRHTAELGHQLTTELAGLVRTGTCTLDAANDILTHVGLAPLPDPEPDADGPHDDHDGSASPPTSPAL